MKRVTLALLLLFSITTIAQQGINYKALIKDGGGTVISSQMITVQFQILQGAGMTNVYQETHTPTTDATGIVIINIGEVVTPDSGVFADIDWGSDTHFLNTKINTGAGLVDMGTTGFKAVPYALSSEKTESVSGTTNFLSKFNDGSSVGDSQLFDDGTNVGIGTSTPTSKMDLRADGIGFSQQLDAVSPSIGFYTNNGAAWLQTHNDFPLRFSTNNGATQMILSTNGNLGIGTTSLPTAKLDVLGDLKITDGTQGAGKILTSDADGLASWEDGYYSKAYIDALEARIAALEPQPASIGDIREGGVVFWVDSTGLHGLVCAFSDYVSTREWGCYGTDLPNVPNVTVGPSGLGAEIGDGINNTNKILNDCPSAPAALAARSCGPEWFLPSANELNQMYVNRAIINATASANGGANFTTNYYWSSTESNFYLAWRQVFNFGYQSPSFKFNPNYVRAVRAF